MLVLAFTLHNTLYSMESVNACLPTQCMCLQQSITYPIQFSLYWTSFGFSNRFIWDHLLSYITIIRLLYLTLSSARKRWGRMGVSMCVCVRWGVGGGGGGGGRKRRCCIP